MAAMRRKLVSSSMLWYKKHLCYVWYRELGSGTQERKAPYREDVKAVYLRRFSLPQTMQAAAAVLTGVLFLPTNKVFESVDAVCPSRGYVIQNTVADKHDLKFAGLREIFKVFPQGQVSRCHWHACIMLFQHVHLLCGDIGHLLVWEGVIRSIQAESCASVFCHMP